MLAELNCGMKIANSSFASKDILLREAITAFVENPQMHTLQCSSVLSICARLLFHISLVLKLLLCQRKKGCKLLEN